MRHNENQRENICNFKSPFKEFNKYFHITYNQLKVIVSQKKVVEDKIYLKDKTMSKGAYYRIKRQAISNITKTIMTVAMLNECDIISYHDITSLIITISHMISEDIPIDQVYEKILSYLKANL